MTYFFVPPSAFSSLISKDAFVECTTFGRNYHGTSKRAIADGTAKGSAVVLDIEMEGVERVKESGSSHTSSTTVLRLGDIPLLILVGRPDIYCSENQLFSSATGIT